MAQSYEKMSEKPNIFEFFRTKVTYFVDHGVSSIAAINRHWVFINDQITKTFNGEKTIAIDIEK